MAEIRYLIVGASHAGLTAAETIRRHDPEGTIAILSRETHPPYSPTILPYVVSSRSRPETVTLRPPAWFERHAIAFHSGREVTAIDPAASRVRLADGDRWDFEKLLLATGAAPILPPIPGLGSVACHVLRTLDDATGLQAAMREARTAVVLGAGLIGMHAAENLAAAGAQVTVIEQGATVLPAYFEPAAADLIGETFRRRGVALRLGRRVVEVAASGAGCMVVLDDGSRQEADLLLVAAGVKPALDWLQGSGIATDQGILVDASLRTSRADVWAAGDVAQAPGFFRPEPTLAGILPEAVEQGRIAGMDMAGAPGTPTYPGSVPINTYTFFGQSAISVGIQGGENDGAEIETTFDPGRGRYRRITMQDGRLMGIAAINTPLDPGILWQLILRRVDLSNIRDAFLAKPTETGRALMSRHWR